MTTRLLIECGANVDALDSNENTPLHVLIQKGRTSDVLKTIDVLCDAGAHLDYVNKEGQTALSSVSSFHIEISQYLKDKIGVVRLKCLCARLIKQQFSYENILSTSLVNFVQKH